MKKVALIATPIILLTFMFVAAAYAYLAASDCQRKFVRTTIPPGLPTFTLVNTAEAEANNSGLRFGMTTVHADAGGIPASHFTFYSTTAISWSVSDVGPVWSSGISSATVTGTDPHGVFRNDTQSDSN